MVHSQLVKDWCQHANVYQRGGATQAMSSVCLQSGSRFLSCEPFAATFCAIYCWRPGKALSKLENFEDVYASCCNGFAASCHGPRRSVIAGKL
mmetsp:Transcript_8237/g.23391  ORF Transcript_8237/g.23391 Transcript_8237/m.23391 type:complete len:93 (-) Transcript_8237:59-337(-)